MLSSGTRLGTYEITAHIGSGGMGDVYQAHDTKLGRDVAIKVLPAQFARDSERLARFQREAKMLAALNHPNIATIHGLEQSGSTHYLVMELVPGPTLRERVAGERAVPLEEALTIAKQIAEALEAAHGSEKGIIHRDLKPANVKITPEGRVKVLDFGLAKAFVAEPSAEDISNSPTLSALPTQQGVIMGTAAYMSPEQARGKPVTKATDIWAFGCVLYELLTGKRAFQGHDVTEILAAVMLKEPDLDALPANTPAGVRTLLRRCLRKDHRQRLQDATDARIEIEEALTAPAMEPISVLSTTSGRRQLLFGAAGVAALALASLGGWMLRPTPSPQLVSRFTIALPQGQRLVGENRPPLALSPDGSHLAYAAVQGGIQQLYLRAIDSLEARPMAGTEGAEVPFFSPDGQWIGFAAGGNLKKVAIAGGIPVTLCESGLINGADWGRDDTIVFTPNYGTGLMRVSAAGGEPQVLTTLDPARGELSHRFPQFLPGGRALLFTILTGESNDATDVAVLRLDTGERQLIRRGHTGRYVPTGHLVYSQAGGLFAVPFDPAHPEAASTAPVAVLERVRISGNTSAQYSFAATGTLAYAPASRTDDRNLVWVDRAGKIQILPAPPRSYFTPRLSPDGQKVVAWVIEGDVLIYDLQRGTLTRAAPEGTGSWPIWTPDGKRLVYRAAREGTRNLFWRAADGTGAEERLTTGENPQQPDSWSPDGQLLVFVDSSPAGDNDIWLFRLGDPSAGSGQAGQGRKREPLLQTRFNETRARFSPDGRWIAYQSNESGRNEIYVRPFPGPSSRSQISAEGGIDAAWNPNGRELFYRNGNKMMAVDIATQPVFSASTPRLLFEGDYLLNLVFSPGYDVSRDGQRFLMAIARDPTSDTQINVVLNWFEELKRRVPVN